MHTTSEINQPRAAGEAAQPLPATLRLTRTHPDDQTRLGLLELVAHDHNSFGSEEAMFFAAPEGSDRARIAQACVHRYNSHAALVARLEQVLPYLQKMEADGVDTAKPVAVMIRQVEEALAAAKE